MTSDFKNALRTLTPENRRVIRDMYHYLGTCGLNEVVYEDLMSDLAGMALESQERGVSFSDTVGMDYHAFCRELVKNAEKQSFSERLFDVVRWIAACIGAVMPVMYLYALAFPRQTVFTEGLTLHSPLSFFLTYSAITVVAVLGWFVTKRFIYYSQTIVFPVYLTAILCSFVLFELLSVYTDRVILELSLPLWLIAWALVLVLCLGAKRLIAFTAVHRRNKSTK